MKPDPKNYYLALALSILVVIGWNYFFGQSQLQKARETQAQVVNPKNLNDAAKPGSPNALPPQTFNSPPQGGVVPATRSANRSRKDALADSPRILIETPTLDGSVSLKGALLDDLSLKDYRETPDKNSPDIVLLSPPEATVAYYAQSGFIADGATAPLPGPDTMWTAAPGQKLTPKTPVTLTWDNGKGLTFTRTIAVDKDYMFKVSTSVANKGAGAVTLRPFSLIVRRGLPAAVGRGMLHEGFIGEVGGHSELEPKYADIVKQAQDVSGTGGWAGLTDVYWATVLVPSQTTPFEVHFYATKGATEADTAYQAATVEDAVTIPANGTATTTTRMFAGAKIVGLLDNYESSLGILKFNLLIDWGYMWLIAPYMFYLLDAIYKVVGNFGLAIIGITILLKLVFFPLANRSYTSMAKMKGVQPKIAALKERFPDDKVKQQQEMMALYKTEKINPVAGCLPMLIQIPIFFALYKVLFVTIEMRQAPFFLWIRDLSQPDPTNVFNFFGVIPFNPTTLPLIGHFLAIGILPLIMGVTMFLQMKMNPEPTDPVQKTMFSWMPVVFTFMLGTFPSGLVLYYTVNNTLTLIQQSLIMKRAGVKLELWDNLAGTFRRKAVT